MAETKKRVVLQVVALLKDETLSTEDRNLLTTTVLDKLGALPVRARITFDEAQRCFVDGRPLTLERARKLKSSAQSLLHNFARGFVQDTIAFMAIKQGVHYNTTPEQGLFAKAILWQHNEEQQLYRSLAQEGFEDEDE